MPKKLLMGLITLSLLADISILSAQTKTAEAHTTSKAEVPTRNLDLTHGEDLAGLPPSTVVGYPQRCSSDGDTISTIYADSGQANVAEFPRIFSISDKREVKQLNLMIPTEYKQNSLRSLFAGQHSIVYLIGSSQPQNPTSQERKGQRIFYLSLTDHNGDARKLIKLDLSFEPIQVAVFETGDFLVLGVDAANIAPILAVLNSDGTLKKIIDFTSTSKSSSQDTQPHPNDSNTLVQQRAVVGSLVRAQFVPWGPEILLVQPGTASPIYRFRNPGQQEMVAVTPPAGYLLQSILGSGEKDSWVALMQDTGSLQKLDSQHVIENPQQKLYEINPHTGDLLDEIVIAGPHLGELTCAANHRISAIYYGEPAQVNQPDRLVYASAPR